MIRNKTRRHLVRTAAATTVGLSAVGVASASPKADTVSVAETFDDEGRTWYIESDMPSSSAGRPYDVRLSDTLYADDRQAEFAVNATRGHGTVWIRSAVDVDPGVNYESELSLLGYTPEESYNQISTLRAYVGPSVPENTDDFPDDVESWRYYNEVGGIEANPWKKAGWDQYEQRWETPQYGADQLAIGFQTNWGTESAHLLDDVQLTLPPK